MNITSGHRDNAVAGQSGLEEKEEIFCNFRGRNIYWLDTKCARLFKKWPVFANSFSEGSKAIQEHRKEGKIELGLKSKKTLLSVRSEPILWFIFHCSSWGENSVLRFAFSSALNTAIMFILFRFQTQFFFLFLRPVLLFSIQPLLKLENVYLRGWLDLLFPLGNNRCHGV